MRTSDTLTEIIPAMVEAAKALQDPTKGRSAELKGKSNKTGRDYKVNYDYASLPDFLGAVRNVLAEHGLVMVQSVNKAGPHIETRVLHKSGQWVETEYPIAITPDSQKMGIAHTYARRYSLLQTLAIAPVDDDDGAGASGANAPATMRPVEPRREPTDEQPYRWPDNDRRWFCGALSAVGIRYNDVAGFTESHGWGRPSGWSRPKLSAFLDKMGITWDADEKAWIATETERRDEFDSWLNAGG